jgi:hypothetical protein
MMEHARYWDNFLEWNRDIQRPWDPQDTDSYRQKRAVSWFLHARQCSRDLYALKPTMKSWVPHIACNVVTRQIPLLGDPTRRSADACESFGAMVKKVIKHLTCRRQIGKVADHSKKSGNRWSQTFRRGYVEQCFRRTCVRSRLLHGKANLSFRQREDWRLVRNGKAISVAATSREGRDSGARES